MDNIKLAIKKHATVENGIYAALFIVLIAFMIYFIKLKYEDFDNNSPVLAVSTSNGNISYIGMRNEVIHLAGGVMPLINISLCGNNLFGITANDDIYYINTQSNRPMSFVKIPGKLVQISNDIKNNMIAGVNRNNEIYVANTNLTSNPNWKRIDGSLTNVCISNGKLYGVNKQGEIYFNDNYNKQNNWLKIDGSLKQVDYNGYLNRVVGINSSNNVYYADTDVSKKSPKWQYLNKKMKYVTFLDKNNSKSTIVGIDLNGNVWYYSNNKWEQKAVYPKNLSQISFRY